ncbi:MAG: LuxR family transcriptional regulator [Actinomycetia bacterium]|nr:LuxR family transcriptional regulator [Actinomycetes bacterium]
MNDGLAPGAEALARHDWAAAYDQLQAVGVADLDADAFDRLAEAAWWLSRIDECIGARDAAFHAYQARGETLRAAQCAVWLFEHHCFKAQPSIAGAWLRRARRAIGDDHDCVEYGNLLLREAELLHSSGALAEATVLATEAVELGRRLRSEELEALALQTAGRLAIDRGVPDDGLKQLDEAMLFAIEGRLSPYATGKIYCSLISACDELGDVARAAEWTAATTTWSQQHPLAVFPGLCRVHRAQILGWQGAWEEAVLEAHRACEELETVNVGNAAMGWAEIGDIRRRLGDLDAAEDAFRRAEELSGRPHPGIALLRLAQGRVPAAQAAVARALQDESWNRLARARVLPARVQISIAAGDLDEAASACDELGAIARDYASPMHEASAMTSRGRLALARGECDEACRSLHAAVELWLALEVPYEAATARLLLGQSCRQASDEDSAMAALSAAVKTFDELGAILDAQHTRVLSKASGATVPGGLTSREVEVIALVAEGRTNKDIAVVLGLSIKTVARHLENIFLKLGVSTRSSATAFAIANGLVRDAGAR